MSRQMKKSKILIVDDMPENLGVLFNLLNDHYEVLAAENGSIALEIIEQDKPDLVLLDIMMPDIDGYEVCRILKNSNHTKDIPIIFISALNELENKVKGLNLGAVDYITKPFQQEEVLARINSHLEIKRLNDKLVELNSSLEEKVKSRTQELEDKITENESMNKALQQSESKFKAIFDGAPESILLVEFETGQIVDMNKAGCELIGLQHDEIIGRDHGEFFIPVKEDNALNDYESLRGKYPNNLRTADGTLIPIENSIKTMIINGNIYLLGIMRDVSDRIKYQKGIIDAKNKAEESDKLKSIFLANMSHELRTPLISILGFSNILQEEIEDEDIREMVTNIHTSGMRLLDTFNLLLNLTELESGNVKVNKEILIPTEVINEIVDEMRREIENKSLKLILDYQVERHISVDRIMFKEMVENLLGNAVKFTSKGSIGIKIIDSPDKNGYCDIIFTDSGIGMKEEYLTKIFHAFRQGSEGNNRNYEGTGLGLTITKKFVDLNEGSILVESEEGAGSKFTLRLKTAQLNERKSENEIQVEHN